MCCVVHILQHEEYFGVDVVLCLGMLSAASNTCFCAACVAHSTTDVWQASNVGIVWLKYDHQAQAQAALALLVPRLDGGTLHDLLHRVSRGCWWSAFRYT